MTDADRNAQRTEALKLANRIRLDRSKIRRDLKAGVVSVTDLIKDPPDCIIKMQVLDLLLATPRFGRGKANRVLTSSRVGAAKEVGSLSDRQRGELTWAIRRIQPNSPRR